MRGLKAVIVGCVFILVATLMLQLVYIFFAVGYNALAQDYPLLNDIVGIFRYLVGIPVFIITMFAGGYLTANVAAMKTRIDVLLLCISVGVITAGGMIYPSLEGYTITMTGIVIIIMAVMATAAGGLYWNKKATI